MTLAFETAREILKACLRSEPLPAERIAALFDCALAPATAIEGSRALFGVLVEGLSDRFEPRLSDVYAGLFSNVIASVIPDWSAQELLERYRRVRAPRRFEGSADGVRNVFVLSRVTLGADIAITSLFLDAAKRRFPRADIILAGSAKSYELFSADPRIAHLPIAYGRSGTLRERLAAAAALREEFANRRGIVIDPDSRLTQLGLLPVCREEDYYFFDSRAFGEDGREPLAQLTRRWLDETFGIADAQPFLALRCDTGGTASPAISVSFGVGGNPAKRIPDPFEEDLLRCLMARGAPVVIDTGAGGEEAERVERAISRLGAAPEQVRAFRGSFAAFAGMIARSRLYVGYDSAGQHAAAALGVPMVSIFAGFPCPRMFDRWRPSGRGPIEVVRVENPDPAEVLAETLRRITRMWSS